MRENISFPCFHNPHQHPTYAKSYPADHRFGKYKINGISNQETTDKKYVASRASRRKAESASVSRYEYSITLSSIVYLPLRAVACIDSHYRIIEHCLWRVGHDSMYIFCKAVTHPGLLSTKVWLADRLSHFPPLVKGCNQLIWKWPLLQTCQILLKLLNTTGPNDHGVAVLVLH